MPDRDRDDEDMIGTPNEEQIRDVQSDDDEFDEADDLDDEEEEDEDEESGF
jgi:hypothetical protein